jgi:hypothetical protein
VGRDEANPLMQGSAGSFNPRAPRGARRLYCNSFDFCVLALELRELIQKLKQ